MSDLRTVFDTNILISAVLLPRSVPRQAFDLARQQGRLLVSEATIAELDRVLRRPKFNRYLLEEERLEFLVALVREAELVEVTKTVIACRDPKDNLVLELALSGDANYIVTGDADLLVLHPFRDIPIVTAQDFLTQAQRKSGRTFSK